MLNPIATTAEHNGLFQNDTYRTLEIDITSNGCLADGAYLRFRADTDLLTQAIPEASQVLAMSMVGMASLFWVQWRRRKQTPAVA